MGIVIAELGWHWLYYWDNCLHAFEDTTDCYNRVTTWLCRFDDFTTTCCLIMMTPRIYGETWARATLFSVAGILILLVFFIRFDPTGFLDIKHRLAKGREWITLTIKVTYERLPSRHQRLRLRQRRPWGGCLLRYWLDLSRLSWVLSRARWYFHDWIFNQDRYLQ